MKRGFEIILPYKYAIDEIKNTSLNKQLKQHDIEQWSYSAKESSEFRKINNEEALWSNSMFSGMPAYLTDVKWSNEIIGYTHKLYSFFFPHPTNILLISFLSFYFM